MPIKVIMMAENNQRSGKKALIIGIAVIVLLAVSGFLMKPESGGGAQPEGEKSIIVEEISISDACVEWQDAGCKKDYDTLALKVPSFDCDGDGQEDTIADMCKYGFNDSIDACHANCCPLGGA